MLRNSRSLLSALLLLAASTARAGTDYALASVFGLEATGCAQVAVNSSTQARSAALTIGSFYVLYCVSGTDFSTGDACRYVQGGASIDVTSIGSSLVGKVIAAGQQEVIYVKSGYQYVSAVSKTASGIKLEICKLTPLN